MPKHLRILAHFLSTLDRQLQVALLARPLGAQPDPRRAEPFVRDPDASGSPYLEAHMSRSPPAEAGGASRTGSTGRPKTSEANELLERLSVFLYGLGEFVKVARQGDRRTAHQSDVSWGQTSVDHATRWASDEKRSTTSDDWQTSANQQTVQTAHATFVAEDRLSTGPENLASTTGQQTTMDQTSIAKAAYASFQLPQQRLADQSKAQRVPASRIGRIASYGELAAGLGLGALSQLTRRTLGMADAGDSLLLNEANANRIVETLCRVRGAALKIGQLFSIQDTKMISPELQRIFERVRASADFMPDWQLRRVLADQLGVDWQAQFAEFELKPFAAASIGQVHRAVHLDGRELAVKVQYPGVAEGIESDLKNLMAVLRLWNILPAGMFIETLMEATRRELRWEVDYRREAAMASQYADVIASRCAGERLQVPRVVPELSADKVITAEMIHGVPLDRLPELQIDQAIIDDVAGRVMTLCFREIFEFRLMQTDPNWSNFFYDPATDMLSLIDFGACREYGKPFVDRYLRILKAAADSDRAAIERHSVSIGFLTGFESPLMRQAHVESVMVLGQVFHRDAPFDFAAQDISQRIAQIVPTVIEHRLVPPPEEIYSLHRKMSGIFTLMTKLRAKVNVKRTFDRLHAQYEFDRE